MSAGFVSLIGAGPGDPGLLTIRAAKAIGCAEAVLYDHLVHPDVLAHASSGAEIIYTGKQGGTDYISQKDLTSLMLDRARTGKRVARIKGGDPFIFGRGGEEALACAEAGIAFEVIPGVSSAHACPAYAGIPLTHRDLASHVTFVTGHEGAGKEGAGVDWNAIANTGGTLCFLMGMKNLPDIAGRLVGGGLPPDTPAAAVEWGTYPRQRTVTSKLSGIAAECAKAGLGAPAVVVVGKVAALREKLAWFEKKPLFGLRVLVTRPEGQAAEISGMLSDAGAEPVHIPLIRIAGPANPSKLRDALSRLQEFDFVLFTSVNAVDHFFGHMREMGFDSRSLCGVRVAAIGPVTASALEERGILPDLKPAEFTSDALVSELSSAADLKGKSILLPRSSAAPQGLRDSLAALGAAVEEVEAYRTLSAEPGPEALEKAGNRIDASVFMSSSAAEALASGGCSAAIRALVSASRIFSIGPETSGTLRRLGYGPLEAAVHTSQGVVATMLDFYRNRR